MYLILIQKEILKVFIKIILKNVEIQMLLILMIYYYLLIECYMIMKKLQRNIKIYSNIF